MTEKLAVRIGTLTIQGSETEMRHLTALVNLAIAGMSLATLGRVNAVMGAAISIAAPPHVQLILANATMMAGMADLPRAENPTPEQVQQSGKRSLKLALDLARVLGTSVLEHACHKALDKTLSCPGDAATPDLCAKCPLHGPGGDDA